MESLHSFLSLSLPSRNFHQLPVTLLSEDISANMGALEDLQAEYNCDLLFVEYVVSAFSLSIYPN
jgi:hypothetical protein